MVLTLPTPTRTPPPEAFDPSNANLDNTSPTSSSYQQQQQAEEKPFTAWIPTPLHPTALSLARKYFNVIQPEDEKSLNWWEFANCSIVTSGKLTKNEIEKAGKIGKLKIITRNGVGVDSIPLSTCKSNSIIVTNQPGCNSKAVAEIVLGLAISLKRKLAQIDRTLRSGSKTLSIEWRCIGLESKKIGLVGMGDIAKQVAKKFIGAFECEIIVYSPTSSLDKWTGEIKHERVSTLEELLKLSDVVSLHCPLNDQTRGLIGERELEMMKDSAIILNTARGGLIDEVALARALRDQVIFGAGIDTLESEPPTLNRYPDLLSLENVIVLPHVGAQEEDSTKKALEE
ncbi:hypothetical protein JCM3765_005911 [Sporobolomyces pararoseus]